jgi:glycosyltransferase involved in cell wall biosynthesis
MISIIIPCYNATKALADCLNSIIIQNYTNFEILIIDGGSADDTMKIVQLFAERNSNIRFISEKDNGIYDAMNKGITIAKGEWLYFMGSDDRLMESNSLQITAQHLSEKWDIVYGDTVWIPENFFDRGEIDLITLMRRGLNHQRVFYRKSLFEKFGLYKTCYKIAADLEMNIRLFCSKSVKIKYESIPLTYYNSAGFSSNKVDEKFYDDYKLTLLKNYSGLLSRKQIYGNLHAYCWSLIRRRKSLQFIELFVRIYFTTFSLEFVKQTLSELLKHFKVRIKQHSFIPS